MSSCRNVKPIGCPDCQTKLICFRPRNHDGDCYDAMGGVWWRDRLANEPEPRLVVPEVGTVRRGAAAPEKAPETITRDEPQRGPRCGCCGTKETRPGEITCSQCAGWEDHAMDHEATGHRQIYPTPHAPTW
jgi:hypothetical protein